MVIFWVFKVTFHFQKPKKGSIIPVYWMLFTSDQKSVLRTVSNNLFIVLNRWLKFWKWTSAKNNDRLISVTRKIRLANHHYRFIDLAEQKSFKQMIFFTPNCLAYGMPHTMLNFRSQNIISTQDLGFWSKSITQGVLPIL